MYFNLEKNIFFIYKIVQILKISGWGMCWDINIRVCIEYDSNGAVIIIYLLKLNTYGPGDLGPIEVKLIVVLDNRK